MELLIVRHAIAVEHGDPAYKRDDDRPLTPEGMHKFRLAARGLREFTEKPDSALTARLEREAALIRQAWLETHVTPRLWRDPFERPRDSHITSVYGTGREFNGVVQNRHLGTDFRGAVGDPIRASNDGVVTLIGDFYYSGNMVVIDHGRVIVANLE